MACHFFKAAAAVCAALACGFPSAGHGAEQPLSLTAGAGGTWNADWTGGAGEADHRVFFFQWSVNLTDWHYASFMDFGPGLKSHGIDTGGAPKFFARLLYFDFPEIESLEQAEEEDFDGDGLSTIAELEDHATDPFLWDSDGDWLPDNFEVENGLDPNDDGGIDPSNGRDGDPDADGLSNFDEWWHGSDPHDPDSDGDMLSDGDEVHLHHSSPVLSDSDLDGLDDHAEVMTHGTDPANADTDDDTLFDYEEVVTHGTNPLDIDTDGDWMWDDFEIANSLDPLDPADGLADADGDGLVNKLEFVFMDLGQELFTADAANFSWTGDPDGDGLTTSLEFTSLHLHPRQHDTDSDSMDDGWENQHAAHGFDPRTDNATDGDPDNDASADPDNDNLTNEQESALGTNPKNPDTDGDGVNDDVEDTQGTNPNDPNDHLPPPQGTVAVHVTFGDHSGSHSQKYKVIMEPLEGDTQERKRTNRRYGQVQTDTFHLPKGSRYKVTLEHIGTDGKYRGAPRPDYDYTLKFSSDESDDAVAVIEHDPEGIFGVHDESETFFAEGKNAELFVAMVISETVAFLPSDRKRKKLGVGEMVNLSLAPPSLPSPIWAMGGAPGTSTLNPLVGDSSLLTAGERACTPTVEATINGTAVKINFDVVEPNGVEMEQEQGTGIWHVHGIPSAGFHGRAFISPFDVSFINIEIKEGQCAGTGVGYYSYMNGVVHPSGPWGSVIIGTPQKPSKDSLVDMIQSGSNGPANPAAGSFDWPIPWLFRVAGGAEKQFTIVNHHQECDATGKVTISKGGFSASKNLNDPTSN